MKYEHGRYYWVKFKEDHPTWNYKSMLFVADFNSEKYPDGCFFMASEEVPKPPERFSEIIPQKFPDESIERFEYKDIPSNYLLNQRELNEYGKHGWELCHYGPDGTGFNKYEWSYIFKRKIS